MANLIFVFLTHLISECIKLHIPLITTCTWKTYNSSLDVTDLRFFLQFIGGLFSCLATMNYCYRLLVTNLHVICDYLPLICVLSSPPAFRQHPIPLVLIMKASKACLCEYAQKLLLRSMRFVRLFNPITA